MNILGIIPARAGSKGIPRKNMYPIAGKPLLWHTFQAIRTSTLLSRTILSTDDEEFAAYGQVHQVEVPFLRPSELAQDNTPSLNVIQHVITFLEKSEGYQPDLIVLVQPTAPLRQGQHIDEAIQLLLNSNAEAVVSVTPIPAHFNPYWLFTINSDNQMTPFLANGGPVQYPRRQLLPPLYYRNGAVYVTRREVVMEQNSLYGSSPLVYVMPPDVSVNIDTLHDIWIAEQLLNQELALNCTEEIEVKSNV